MTNGTMDIFVERLLGGMIEITNGEDCDMPFRTRSKEEALRFVDAACETARDMGMGYSIYRFDKLK
jgi:hypothetical protein